MNHNSDDILPGVLIILAALFSLVICNIGYDIQYNAIWSYVFELSFGPYSIQKQFLPLINEGLMAVFFLVVTLEIKYECLYGFLNNARLVRYPLMAALGGMVVPAMIYLFFNYPGDYAVGWAIPTATDIAFSLGCLLLLGNNFPPTMRVFLLSLAIFDDLGAIIIIAIYYSEHLSLFMLLGASFIAFHMFAMNYFGVRRQSIYVLLSLILWVLVLKSGVHATLTGCLLALMLPMSHDNGKSAMQFRHKLLPWVQYFILPLFALANTGVLLGSSIDLFHPIALGIIGGLVLGKPIGIVLFGYVSERLGLALRPKGLKGAHILGVSFLCGIGFTMSLFVGMLAFDERMDFVMDIVRVSVLLASLISGVIGMLFLYRVRDKKGRSNEFAEVK